MQINPRTIFLTVSLLLTLNFVAYATEDSTSAPTDGTSDTPAQLPSETSTTEPGEIRAEGADKSKTHAEGVDKTFTPSETISADSAVAFPVDI